jgi:hypothetical protein
MAFEHSLCCWQDPVMEPAQSAEPKTFRHTSSVQSLRKDISLKRN